MKERRVVVTGIGAVTPVGTGARGLWSGVRAGQSAVRRLTRFDPSELRSQLAAEVDGFDPLDYVDARAARKMDRYAHLGIAAALQAYEDACLSRRPNDSRRMGVSVGSALGGVAYGEQQHCKFLNGGIRSVAPLLATTVYGGASAANIAIQLDVRGPNTTNANSCASGAIAIGEALRMIERGEADVMLAGGVEAPLAPLSFGAFALIRAMSTRNDAPQAASRPFDVERDGFVMAEGSAMLVLEERRHALGRDAHIYAELIGYGQTNDAYHMTAPRPDGSEAARAVSLALTDAVLTPNEVDYVNAHATGTVLGDAAESLALGAVFGCPSGRPRVSGTKGLYGHPLGASGAIEACITVLALTHSFAPGSINLTAPDPACLLSLVLPEGEEMTIRHAVSTSFGFGGVNAALVFRAATS